jgi:hypothetical protein
LSIPASAQILALQEATRSIQFVDSSGKLTQNGFAALDAVFNFVNGCCRFIPCNASTTSNVITLTMLSTSPLVKGYADFDTFRFVADATSTGLLSAKVVTPQGALTALNIYKSNGSAQATTGDITINLQYDLTFVDSLNSGNGGFVLR